MTASTSLPDDGIVDEIAVERLANGTLSWRAATLTERYEAARFMFRRGSSWDAIAAATNLRSQTLRTCRADVMAVSA